MIYQASTVFSRARVVWAFFWVMAAGLLGNIEINSLYIPPVVILCLLHIIDVHLISEPLSPKANTVHLTKRLVLHNLSVAKDAYCCS